MKIALTGSTGFVGKAILGELLSCGHEVISIIRRESEWKLGSYLKEYGEKQLVVVYKDLSEEKFKVDLQGCSAIIHLVAILKEIPEAGISYYSLNFESARKLMDLAKEQGIKRFLFMSSIKPPPYILRGYYQTKKKAEEYLKSSSLEWTIFKPSFIYGKKVWGKEIAWIRILKPFFGTASLMSSFLPGGISTWMKELEPISLEEVSRAFLNVLEGERYRFSTLSGSSLFEASKGA